MGRIELDINVVDIDFGADGFAALALYRPLGDRFQCKGHCGDDNNDQ